LGGGGGGHQLVNSRDGGRIGGGWRWSSYDSGGQILQIVQLFQLGN
jgi:hypothetical protein